MMNIHENRQPSERKMRLRRFGLVLAVLSIGGGLGLLSPQQARADDATYKCDVVENSCYAGSHTNCKASCGPDGCSCKASDAE